MRVKFFYGWVALVTLSAALPLVACTGQYAPDENSGADVSRTGALVIPLETAVTDAINVLAGDSTDWKQFVLEQPGLVTVEIFWDNPLVEGSLSLHDQFGEHLETVTHVRNSEGERMVVRVNDDGIYYVRVHCDAYRSTYSLRVWPFEHSEGVMSSSTPRPELAN